MLEFLFVPFVQGNVYDYFNGKIWTAQDIGIKERTCGRMQNGFMSVNTTLQAGRFFLADLYQQFANWGVDFGKLTQLHAFTESLEIYNTT